MKKATQPKAPLALAVLAWGAAFIAVALGIDAVLEASNDRLLYKTALEACSHGISMITTAGDGGHFICRN